MFLKQQNLNSGRERYSVTPEAVQVGQAEWTTLFLFRGNHLGSDCTWKWENLMHRASGRSSGFSSFKPAVSQGPWRSKEWLQSRGQGGKMIQDLRITAGLWWTIWRPGEALWLLEMKQISRSWRKWQSTAEQITAARARNKSVPALWQYIQKDRMAVTGFFLLEGENDSLRNSVMRRILLKRNKNLKWKAKVKITLPLWEAKVGLWNQTAWIQTSRLMGFGKKSKCSLRKWLTSGLEPGMDKTSLDYLVPKSKKIVRDYWVNLVKKYTGDKDKLIVKKNIDCNGLKQIH